VFWKELTDALRDRRTLMVVLLGSVATGPLALVAMSSLIASMEDRAEARVVLAVGMEEAPSLRNYLERQTYTVEAAPADYDDRLRSRQLGDPVLVVPEGFESARLDAQPPVLTVVGSTGNQPAEVGQRRLVRLLQGFAQEQATLRLAARGVAPALLEAVRVEERDVASGSSRAAQLTSIVPFFVVMAVLYGALGGALDTTAGERERGSLEPLLMNPATPLQITWGKWAAVAAVAMLIAMLGSFSFIPAQALIRSETLSAMFQYGLREAAVFVAILVPLAGALSALLMAVAIRSKTVKEAQANASIVLLGVSLAPLVGLLAQGGEARWYLWVPALAQTTLMGRVLRGEATPALDLLVSAGVSVVLIGLALGWVARQLRAVAVR
jgi:sodium transport system permease protein